MDRRLTRDERWILVAFGVAGRATCDRRSVGCVLVKDDHEISTGYNGAPKGAPHCDEVNHGWPPDQEVPTCRNAVHAEQNAISYASNLGRSTQGATAYITDMPCTSCYGALINAGITRIVAAREYKKGREYNGIPVEILKLEQDVIDDFVRRIRDE